MIAELDSVLGKAIERRMAPTDVKPCIAPPPPAHGAEPRGESTPSSCVRSTCSTAACSTAACSTAAATRAQGPCSPQEPCSPQGSCSPQGRRPGGERGTFFFEVATCAGVMPKHASGLECLLNVCTDAPSSGRHRALTGRRDAAPLSHPECEERGLSALSCAAGRAESPSESGTESDEELGEASKAGEAGVETYDEEAMDWYGSCRRRCPTRATLIGHTQQPALDKPKPSLI